MQDELSRIRERVRQNRAARRQTLADARVKTPCPEGRLGCTYVAGDRVFDPVTGEEGQVIGATRENVVVPAPR